MYDIDQAGLFKTLASSLIPKWLTRAISNSNIDGLMLMNQTIKTILVDLPLCTTHYTKAQVHAHKQPGQLMLAVG